MYKLVAFSGEDRGREWPLRAGRNTVGRALDADIQLQDGKASRAHCVLEVGTEVWIEDLGSLNSTYVCGRRVGRERIASGSQISIGDTSLLLSEVHVGEPDYLDRTAVQTDPAQRKLRDYEEQLLGHGIVGRSLAILQIIETIAKISRTDAPVLVTGPTGSGKELCAFALHYCSPRSDRTFVSVSCTAQLDRLLDSELFGHERGAFPGADIPRDGVFHHARGGTIFLDEVCEMPQSTQARLLRVLQDHTYTRAGSSHVELADSRIIAASSRDLARAVATGTFRQDLYYRIHAIRIEIPPLVERVEDIELLAGQFIEKVCCLYSIPPKRLTAEAVTALKSWRWPGNVRELQACIERAVLLGESALITPADLHLDEACT